ncbi:Ig-like domain-containing protein [Cohnella thailandensis]|uniref:Ig-like domain-containing protein n=1 Tax=Cohnella thailandensis TaxID=557557 RepID=A0A841SXL5_9BACL|nr:Ig-like domain-containing protein [Cohnella thailandensis]MBB6634570.1 Ig-like domain-containing protein [Cohnella thailandensis]MBP1972875.1 hypothetical protein [Cohnella thailandensis]
METVKRRVLFRLLLYIFILCLLSTNIPLANAAVESTPSEAHPIMNVDSVNETGTASSAVPSASNDILPDIKETISIIPPITVARGTSVNDLFMLLPFQAEVMMDDNTVRSVDVGWDTSKIGLTLDENAQSFTIAGKIRSEQSTTGQPTEFTNSKNLGFETTVTFASQADSASIVQSIPYVPMPYDLEKQPNPTAASLGLPDQFQVTLGNNSKIAADLTWEIAVQNNFYKVTGILSNLPAGVVNPGFKIASSITTHELSDIKSVPYIDLTAANGAAKTAEGLGLPAQITATLYNGSTAIVPVSWKMDTVNYDPAIRTRQWVYVSGWFNNLPAGVTNGLGKMAFAQVQVIADPSLLEIKGSPAQITSLVPIGAPKTTAGLGLPAQVEVPLSDGTRRLVDVEWRLEWVSYDPASTNAQSFWVTGEFVHLPEGIYNSNGYSASAKVTVKNRYITRYADIYRSLDHGAPRTKEGLQLPDQVESVLDDGSKVMLDVNWESDNVQYDPSNKLEQNFWVYGTVTNLPAGITNVYEFIKVSARITVQAYALHVISDNPIAVTTEVEHGAPATVEGFGLPHQVEVLLSDRSKINVDVNWELDANNGGTTYDPNQMDEQQIRIRGTLTHLPEGVYDNQGTVVWATVKVKKAITDFKHMIDIEYPRLVASHGTAKSLDAFHLPSTVEAILKDGSRMTVGVEWQIYHYFGWEDYSPTNPAYQTFLVSGNVNLPPDVISDIGGNVLARVEVWADQSVKEILEIPEQPFELVNGSQLPREIDVRLDNGNMVKASVRWELTGVPWDLTNYQLAGSLVLPDGVGNSRKEAFKLGFEFGDKAYFRDPDSNLSGDYPMRSFLVSIEPVEIYSGEPLPTQVMATFGDYPKTELPVNVCWYGGLASDEDTRIGIPCGTFKYYLNAYNIVAVAHIKPPAIKAIQEPIGVYPYKELPSEATAVLTNGETMKVSVCYVDGNYPPTGIFSIVAYACNLPSDIVNLSGFFRVDTYYAPGVPEEPETRHKVVDVQQFNEVISQSDLPREVNVTLDDGRTISTGVCWETGDLDNLNDDDVAIATGKLCKLPSADVGNPDQLYSLAYIHKSATDLHFDFDVPTNDSSVEEQLKNVRFVDSNGKITIHVTSYDHPINSATASYNGQTIQLEKISDNEYIAEWKPDVADRGLGIEIPDNEQDYEALTGESVKGAFHTFEVRIYPQNDTVRYIRKQVYIAIRDIDDFKSIITNLPMPRIISPADASYNCLGFALDKTEYYYWLWFDNDGPYYPNHEETVARLDIAGYEQTSDPSEATILAFGSNGQIFHFAKYDSETNIVTSKDAVEEVVEYEGIPQYANHYGTVQLYFKKKNEPAN